MKHLLFKIYIEVFFVVAVVVWLGIRVLSVRRGITFSVIQIIKAN